MDILLSQQITSNQSFLSSIASFLPMILIFLVFYLLILRPQSKQKKEHENLLKSISSGDKILTRGGIYGKVKEIQGKNNEKLQLEISSNTTVVIDRSYIATKIKK